MRSSLMRYSNALVALLVLLMVINSHVVVRLHVCLLVYIKKANIWIGHSILCLLRT